MDVSRNSLIAAGFLVVCTALPSLAETSFAQSTPRGACGCEGEIISEVDIRYGRVFDGNYRHGEPADYVTVNPDGSGETFADAGISIRVRVKCENTGDDWLVGYPAEAFVLYSSSMCSCAPTHADGPSDENGWLQFSGAIHAGGCNEGIDLYGDGIFIATLSINFNSPDLVTSSPCFTDNADLAAFAEVFADPQRWNICFDYNESGPPTIDAADLAYFASRLGASCR